MHTPGPWRVGDLGATVFGPPNGNPSPETIAWLRYKANARLIAAAPDLLAVAKGALGYFTTLPFEYRPDPAWIEPLRAAIAKAEGRDHV